MNNTSEKKGADRLDTRSTDALHWAECFCEQIGADKDMVDDLMPWFANYWAAVNDPLQNKIDLLRNELEIAHGKSLAVSESFAHLESTTYPRDLVDQLIRREWTEWDWDESKIDWSGELCLAEQAGGNFIVTRISNPSHWLKLDVQRFIPLSAFGAKTPQTKPPMTLLQRLKIAWHFVTGSK